MYSTNSSADDTRLLVDHTPNGNTDSLLDVTSGEDTDALLQGWPAANGLRPAYSRQASRSSQESLTLSQRLSLNADDLPPITLSWHNINVWASGSGRTKKTSTDPTASPGPSNYGKQILRNVSGAVQPGSLLAIMGASGAGKTTLLNVLTCRSQQHLCVEGAVRVNGSNIGRGMACMSAYIQQDDIFIGTLKVKEHLWFQAQLRMDKQVPYDMRQARIDAVMKEMNLNRCADVVIGIPGKLKGISGGEKKRLAFACEVLTNPPLMFCDEPTSGLDSFMAQSIVNTLRTMAEKGRTILCTIHQPSSEVFALFDKLLLVADGRVAYMGPSYDTLDFFKSCGYPCPQTYNPADHYIQTLAMVPGKEVTCSDRITASYNIMSADGSVTKASGHLQAICEAFGKSDEASAIGEVLAAHEQSDGMFDEYLFVNQSPYKASWCRQFRAVLWRSWLGVCREPGVFRTRLIQALILSTIFGLVYFRRSRRHPYDVHDSDIMNINGALYLMITQMTYGFVFSVVNTFPPEFPVFKREHHDGMYRVDVYFICKMLAEMVQFITIPIVFGTIMYLLIGFYWSIEAYLICMLTLILVCNAAASFGYVLSCSSSSVAFVLALAPIFITPFMMIGGFYIKDDSIPPYFLWIKYLSWFSYANGILVVNQWKHVEHIVCNNSSVPLILPTTTSTILTSDQTCLPTGLDVIHNSGYDKVHIWANVGYLLALVVGYRVLAFIILSIRSRRR